MDKKNVFQKSAIRQPVKTLILAILVGAAAFAFVSRAVEYVIVTGEIARIENHFRSIGFLRHPDFIPPQFFTGGRGHAFYGETPNAKPAADIIAQDPHIRFGDSLRHVQGELPEGMSNGNIH